MDKYQTIGMRLIAAIIDVVIFIPIAFIVRGVFANGEVSTGLGFGGEVILQFISFSYYVLMHNFYGQTLGKMFMRVEVLDISENPITFFQAILRNFPTLLALIFTINFNNPRISEGTASSGDIWVAQNLLPFLTILLSIFSLANAISLLVTEKHRALHDYIAGTVVVRK